MAAHCLTFVFTGEGGEFNQSWALRYLNVGKGGVGVGERFGSAYLVEITKRRTI